MGVLIWAQFKLKITEKMGAMTSGEKFFEFKIVDDTILRIFTPPISH
jgi:hypothetical protein